MCGPDDEKQKIAREKFSEEFESAFVETVKSGILSSASSLIFDGDLQSVSVPDRPRSRRNGSNKNLRRQIN